MAAVLIGIFVWVAAERISVLRMEAERVAVEHAIGTLKHALGVEAFRRAAADGLAGVVALDGSNPMALLERPPRGYLGERAGAASAAAAPGSWHFDTGRGALVYRARFPEAFPGGEREQVYRVQFRFRDHDGNGQFDPGVDGVQALELAPLTSSDPAPATDTQGRAWDLHHVPESRISGGSELEQAEQGGRRSAADPPRTAQGRLEHDRA